MNTKDTEIMIRYAIWPDDSYTSETESWCLGEAINDALQDGASDDYKIVEITKWNKNDEPIFPSE